MAYQTQSQEEEEQKTRKNLPTVLILKPSSILKIHEKHFCRKFDVLRPWGSPLPTDEFLSTHASSVRALLCGRATPVTADLLRRLPSLRLIVTNCAGVNHIDLPECRRRGISVANAPGIFSQDVAETAVALLIDVLRKISAGDRFVRRGIWPTKGEFPLGSKLGGKQVGIFGLGSIGLEVAKWLEAFGCIISYNSRNKKPSISFPFYADVCELAANCDVLVVCCALTNQTHHMINKDVLSALGKEGVIVNIARGAIIDEKELVRCLVQGEIAGAGLDVFANEPDVPNGLFELDNVVLSPHRAVYMEESFRDTYELMLGTLEDKSQLVSSIIDTLSAVNVSSKFSLITHALSCTSES